MEEQDTQTKLAYKRTELAYERTVLAYFRTGASLILFGLAFLGFSEGHPLFVYGGYAALSTGVIFLIIAVFQGRKHLVEMRELANKEAQRVKSAAEKIIPRETSSEES